MVALPNNSTIVAGCKSQARCDVAAMIVNLRTNMHSSAMHCFEYAILNDSKHAVAEVRNKAEEACALTLVGSRCSTAELIGH
jgi:hypothetical protein